MTIERLRAILGYSKSHPKDISEDIANFCNQIDVSNLNGIRNLLQIVRPYLLQRKYLIIQIPLHDDEIGAFVYKGDSLSYLVINTSMPVLNINFALCHELHHIFFSADEALNKARIDLDYYSNENEMRANEFAGNLLMPEIEFSQMFLKLRTIYADNPQSELKIIVSLMNYFKAPFMAVYIRCYELDLLTSTPQYLDIELETIKKEFEELWLDTADLQASKIDNAEYLIKQVQEKGSEYVEKEYINKRTLQKALENIKVLFAKVKVGA